MGERVCVHALDRGGGHALGERRDVRRDRCASPRICVYACAWMRASGDEQAVRFRRVRDKHLTWVKLDGAPMTSLELLAPVASEALRRSPFFGSVGGFLASAAVLRRITGNRTQPTCVREPTWWQGSARSAQRTVDLGEPSSLLLAVLLAGRRRRRRARRRRHHRRAIVNLLLNLRPAARCRVGVHSPLPTTPHDTARHSTTPRKGSLEDDETVGRLPLTRILQ